MIQERRATLARGFHRSTKLPPAVPHECIGFIWRMLESIENNCSFLWLYKFSLLLWIEEKIIC